MFLSIVQATNFCGIGLCIMREGNGAQMASPGGGKPWGRLNRKRDITATLRRGGVTPPYRYQKSLRRRGGFYIRPRTRVNAICRYVARASATPPPYSGCKIGFCPTKKAPLPFTGTVRVNQGSAAVTPAGACRPRPASPSGLRPQQGPCPWW